MTRADLINWLKGCPHGSGCEPSCPLKGLREMENRAEAYAELLRLSGGEIIDMEQVHNLCPRTKEAQRCGDG